MAHQEWCLLFSSLFSLEGEGLIGSEMTSKPGMSTIDSVLSPLGDSGKPPDLSRPGCLIHNVGTLACPPPSVVKKTKFDYVCGSDSQESEMFLVAQLYTVSWLPCIGGRLCSKHCVEDLPSSTQCPEEQNFVPIL